MELQERMREMFTRMVEAKDASLVDTYYDPDFRLSTNGQEQDLAAFRAGHERVYPTAITYEVEYDEDSWVESGNRIAGRMWITTQRPDEPAHRIEVDAGRRVPPGADPVGQGADLARLEPPRRVRRLHRGLNGRLHPVSGRGGAVHGPAERHEADDGDDRRADQ